MPRRAVAVALVATTLVVGACTSDDDRATRSPEAHDEVVVASFNFPESEVLAEIYALALEEQGIPVRRELDLGSRELVLPALQQGLVDVVPEYLGSVTTAVVPDQLPRDVRDGEAVRRVLAVGLRRWHARPLQLSPAQNVNGVVVTRATAERLGLHSISDLAPFSNELTLGGPPECPERPYCLRGLERVYGLHFAGFVALDGQPRVRRALEDGVIDTGIMFTTDGDVARPEFTLLLDDRGLQPAENIVPIVRDDVISRHGPRLTHALDAVSERLSTENLRFLNWRVATSGHSASDEARGWLLRQGLVSRAP